MKVFKKKPSNVIKKLDSLSPLKIQSIFSLKTDAIEDYSTTRYNYISVLWNSPIGTISLEQNKNDEIYFTQFDPMDDAYFLSTKYNLNTNKTKKSFGLGTLAHVQSLINVLEENPELINFNVVPYNYTEARINHLTSMELPTDEPLDFKTFFEKSIIYARSKGFDYPSAEFFTNYLNGQ